ncbi:MAG: UDP-3-O-acyl-N-acetylglucosamine deacetylase [Planctomycetota bacterium]|nr:UDP-3-O-acyl-N-acetylglucosamine deacetylase [Planctomycetota bacterium]
MNESAQHAGVQPAEIEGPTLFRPGIARLRIRPEPIGGIRFVRSDQRVQQSHNSGSGSIAARAPIELVPPPALLARLRLPANRNTILLAPEPLAAINNPVTNPERSSGAPGSSVAQTEGSPARDHASAMILAATVEHVLSALAGLGLWHATIELDGPEVPIMDGSASAFVSVLAPVATTSIPRAVSGAAGRGPTAKAVVLDRQVVVRDERDPSVSIMATPREAPGFSATYHFEYPKLAGGVPRRGALASSSVSWHGDAADYAARVAPARTYCLRSEAEQFRAMGLFTHLSARDMLVIDDATGEAIENELRFPDEPARHKLLDLIGDLALLGGPLQADVVATRSGHSLTHELVRQVYALRPAANA